MSGEKAGFRAKLTNIFLEPRELREYQSDVEPRSGNKANELAHFAGGGAMAFALMALGSVADVKGITAPKGVELDAAFHGLIESSSVMVGAFVWMASDILAGPQNSAVINSLREKPNPPTGRSRAERRRMRVKKSPK